LINKAIAKIFGTSNEREIKRLMPGVAQINAFEPQIKQLTDEQLRAKTDEFRAKIQERIVKFEEAEHRQHALKEVLDEILPEAFAVCREASWRVLNMRHFDVQLIGGIVLHHGKIAEMKTGEGKTLVATLPVYLNALSGLGVHVVTVNDYLAKRDSEWMGKLYSFLGLSVGVIVHDLDDEQRREAYRADVTYGTNNEFGFDYLRDNMKFELRDCVQREFNFAIVDEVDSILIDEARTPLIISGASEESTDKYQRVNVIIPKLEKGEEIEGREPGDKILTGDFVIDEKHKTITVSDEGWEKVEKLLGIGNIADPENWDLKHHVEVAIKAHALYKRDVEYVVKDGEVIIVDEFTGRLMPGRRWSDGLHQAVEAKENVKVERENQTLATITFQNYFRLYKKLAGMTGTAETEAPEFDKIYKLEVVVIPTNRTLLRKENPDVVYRTEKEKFFAVADSIAELKEKQQPVLVGTVSIEKSERISKLLERKGIEHVVLNAKHHEREAEFVAQAGRLGRVTIATNMAGRGTDILLGGNAEFLAKQECVKKGIAQPVHEAGGEVTARPDDPTTVYWYYAGNEYICPKQQWDEVFAKHKAATDAEHAQVIAAGGLFILGTERHESRRIDNQLRGRAGRQGDPGASRFFLSLEDDLMRIFAKEWVSTLLQRLGMEEGVPIESKMISRRIEKAQEAVEGQNFEARKHLLEYDDVMNKQRKAVYGLRRQLLEGLDQKELIIEEYVTETLGELLDKFADKEKHPEDWDIAGLKGEIFTQFGVDILAEGVEAEKLNRVELGDQIFEKLKERYDAKEQLIGPDQMRHHERVIMLSVIDQLWKDHLLNMDHLKEGIGLRGYAQHDPLVEYKRESFDMFEEMMNTFKEQTVRYLYLMQIIDAATNRPVEFTRRPPQNVIESGPATSAEPQTSGNGHQPPPPQRKAATSLDDMERQFERKKRRELEQARMAGASMPDSIQQVVKGEKIGRNDPCHCGSGKKYKKCHGA
jgi:preprotein translocase subunit SecA